MSIETAIIAPAVLLLIAVILQAGLWFHARDVAGHAAARGAVAASAEHADDAAGQVAATAFLTQVGSLRSPGVTVQRGPATVTVTVTGTSPTLVPGLPLPSITRTSTSPIERWQP